ncbi:hypothetical protein GP486_006422 [Trichoglossum hirsutum]|uniref:Shugoshin C-terminal domain-containing protein n=1 Tax=Trichoglossum hirsutum TaxID=265104 RepID=A0A9P8L7T5_9PEZI|nr:hypothetical protein GP486_006422 [Trichoglossum hirsutum]
MARLNEQQSSAETIEAPVISAQADRDSGRRVLNSVEDIKKLLEDKLRELGGLVSGLGAISLDASPRNFRVRRSPGQDQKNWKNTFTLSEVTSNHEGRLPPILEDKLYPRLSIDSNESYPPRPDPINAPDSSLSPELEPPPVAHFEGEPITFDPNRRVDAEEILGSDIGDGITAYQPVNLEMRRKRKDSTKFSDVFRSAETSQHGPRQLSVTESQIGDVDASQSVRTSIKRKLSERDEDEKPEKPLPAEPDDFKFNRRVATGRGRDEHRPSKTNTQPAGSKGGSESTQESGIVYSASKERSKKQTPTVSSRRALGPKSTNTDPLSSPAKTGKTVVLEDVSKKDVTRKTVAAEHGKARSKRHVVAEEVRPKHMGSDVDIVSLELQLDHREPETPCPSDLLSPVDSQPSAARPITRDTPPPPDLNLPSTTGDGLNSVVRATRRPRGSVNYAEPNLRDKMRRPTRELVDAVAGEGKGHRISGVKMEGGSGGSGGSRFADGEGSANEKTQIRTVVIKREEGGDQSWKKLQSTSPTNKESSTALGRAYKTVKAREIEDGSPLNSKGGGNALGELPNSIITQRRRRTSALHRDEEEFANEQSTAAAALSELRKRPSKSEDRRTDIAVSNRERRGVCLPRKLKTRSQIQM